MLYVIARERQGRVRALEKSQKNLAGAHWNETLAEDSIVVLSAEELEELANFLRRV
jgi:hypothetical protein